MPRAEIKTYFNNFEQSGYEELKDWTPSYYQDIKEADANLQFAGKTIDQMAQALEEWCANMFIDTMSEDTLSRIEAFYYLNNSGKTIEERRKILKTVHHGNGKINADRIKRIIMEYGAVDCNVEFPDELKITLKADTIMKLEDYVTILGPLLPAHLAWQIHQEINQPNTVTMLCGMSINQICVAPTIMEASNKENIS